MGDHLRVHDTRLIGADASHAIKAGDGSTLAARNNSYSFRLVDEALWAGLEAGEKLKSVAVGVANQFGLDHRATYDRAVALRAERRTLEGGAGGAN